MTHKRNPPNSSGIRQKAEELHKLQQSKLAAFHSETDMLKLIHELEVHQIELEIQKEQITDKAAEALEAAEKYTNLFDFAPIGYFTLDKTGSITSLNLMGATMLGKSRLHLLNAKFGFFVSDGTKRMFNQMLEKAFISHDKISAEVTLINSLNQSMYVHLNCICNTAGMNCLVTAVDITERKQAEEKHLQGEIKFQTVADFTYDWEYWKGIDDKFIYISPSCERITGYTPEEFLQDSMLINSIIHPDDAEAYENHYQMAHSYNKNIHPEETEYRIIKKDGSIAYIGHICQHVHDTNGNNLGLRVSNREITGRKHAEEALLETSEKYRALSEAAFEAIFLSEKGICIEQNLFAEKMFGYSNQEAIGMLGTDWIVPEDQELVKNNMLSGYSEPYEATAIRKDGTTFPCLLHGKMMHYKGRNVRITSLTDISERKKAENQIIQKNQLLQKLNSDKNRFMHILAHDLRNPLLNITGFLALLKKNIRTYDIEKIEDHVNTINNTSIRMFALLDDILKWAFAHSEQSKFTPKQINLSSVCEEIVKLSDISIVAKNINISYAQTANISVFADINMLKSILRNLITNAIKFSNPYGTINIKAEHTETEVSITVSDFGIGIAPDKLINLFDLAQIHSTPGTEGEKGTGLGLMLCKEFVERHGGKIYAQSTIGKGSDFVFVLPNN